MNVKKQVRAALAVAVSSTLLIPGYVLAAEKPAQPGTVRPADKAVAQPGTDKQARSENNDADTKPSTAQPGTDKPSQKPTAENSAPKSQAPAQPSVADKPDTPAPQAPAQPSGEDKPVTPAPSQSVAQQPSAPAPTPNYSDVSDQNTVPAVAQQPAQPVQSEQTTGGQTMADQATEKTASQSVRDSANGTVEEEETQPVRTTQADEQARFELASDIERDGDVRQDATEEEKAVTREDEKPNLAPVEAPDGEPDNDGDTTPQPNTDVAPQPNTDVLNQTISAGASVAGAAGNTAVEFDASPVASTLSANSAASTVSATVDHVAKQVTVEAGNAEFQVQAPVAVEQIVPPQVSQAVDQAAQQAQTAINSHLSSLPNGEQVRDTAIGQVETWFQAK